MKRYLLALALLLVGGAGLNAQTVTVTGHMKSGNTSNVTSKAFMRFRLRNFSGNTPRVTSTGAIVQTQFDVAPDNTGTITTTLYGNDVISPVNTFWTVETWYNGVFQFSYNYGICASTQVTYCSTVGATFNLDSASPISFPTPPAPYLPLPGPTGPTGPQGPIGPQGPPGAGGSGPTLQTNNGTNASQTLLNLLNGSNVTMTNSGGGVTVNAIPSTPAGCLQYDNAGAFAGASGICTPDGKSLQVTGTDPWADVIAFGARANVRTPTDNSTTAICTNGSPNVTLASIGFVGNWLNGDGITLQGCGATFSLSTPSAPTVTPSFLAGEAQTHDVVNSNTGSSTYSYCIVVRDKFGGLSPCGSTTTITNGLASLGLQTAAVTGVSLSNDTLTVTSTTSLTAHALVDLLGITGYPWLGWSRVTTNPGTTLTFAAYPIDSRAMPSNLKDITTGVSVGGTLAYYTLNFIHWTAVTGAWEYYVCAERPGDSSLHLIGVTRPSDNGYTDTSFEDLGATYLGGATFPYYATDAICTGGGQNDPLTTTIVSGAGTTSIVVNNNASQNSSGLKAVHDSAPNILAALNSVSGSASPFTSGYVYFPPASTNNESYPINSFLQLPTKVNLAVAGQILFGETMEMTSNVIDGRYANVGVTQFATCGGASLNSPGTNGANPALYIMGAANTLRNVNLVTGANAGINAVSYGGDLTLDCTSWNTLGTSSDYAGINLILETDGSLSNDFFDNTTFITGPNQVADKSWTPSLWAMNNGQSGGPIVKLTKINWSARGMAISGATVDADWTYRQGGITPMFALQEAATAGGSISLKNEFQDTEGQATVALWSAAVPQQSAASVILKNVTGGTTSLLVQGNRSNGLDIESYSNGVNNTGGEQNRLLHESASLTTSVISSPYNAGGGTAPATSTLQRLGEPLVMQGGYSMGAALNPPTSITCANAAGGSVPNGTYVYTLSSIDYRGGSSMIQPQISASCTATTGNNTNNLTWVPALGAVTYNVYRAATSVSCISGYTANGCGFALVASGVTGTSYSDTSATTTNNAPTVTAGFISGMDNTATWSPTFVCPETTAPSGVAGFDISYCDTTSHQWKDINNNGTAQSRAGFTIIPTNTDCVDWSGTGGLLGDAGGKCGHYTITPTNGDCVTWSGTGGLLGDAGAACGTPGGGMDTNMDNMANPTLMNHSLVPASANTIAVGTQALPFTNTFLGTVANQAGSFDTSALTANHVIKFPNADSTAVQNCASVSHEWISQILQSTGACTQTQPTLADVAAGASPAGLFNFSGSTIEIPQGAAFTAAANSTLGIDTTAKALHSWINAADSLVASFASAPAGSKCAQTSGTIGQLTEAAAACGTTTPSSSDTFTNKTYNAESTGNALSEPVRAYFGAGGCNNSTASNGFDIGVTNAPTPQCAGTTVRKGVLQFARGNVAYLNFHLPKDWNSGASVDLEICFTTVDTTNGHVTSFNIQTGFNKTDGTVTDDPSLNSSQALSVTTGASQTSGGELCGSLTGLTTTGSAADYNAEIAITRNNSGTDTNSDTAVAVKNAQLVFGVTKNAANR